MSRVSIEMMMKSAVFQGFPASAKTRRAEGAGLFLPGRQEFPIARGER